MRVVSSSSPSAVDGYTLLDLLNFDSKNPDRNRVPITRRISGQKSAIPADLSKNLRRVLRTTSLLTGFFSSISEASEASEVGRWAGPWLDVGLHAYGGDCHGRESDPGPMLQLNVIPLLLAGNSGTAAGSTGHVNINSDSEKRRVLQTCYGGRLLGNVGRNGEGITSEMHGLFVPHKHCQHGRCV